MVPSINLCGQNRNHPAPARGGLPCAGRVNLDGSARTASSASSARATRMSRALLATSSPSCHPCQGQGHSCMELTLALAWQTRRRGCRFGLGVALAWIRRGCRFGSGMDKERTLMRPRRGCRCVQGEDVDAAMEVKSTSHGVCVAMATAVR